MNHVTAGGPVERIWFRQKRDPHMTTTNEIADWIAAEHSLTKVQSEAVVEAVFSAITAAATSGAETAIPALERSR
jgi:DNA-binding protein HU-beta